MNTQPEALRHADFLEEINQNRAAAELRRLHALNQELLEALKNMVLATKHLNVCPGTVEQAEAVIAKAGEQK